MIFFNLFGDEAQVVTAAEFDSAEFDSGEPAVAEPGAIDKVISGIVRG